MPIASCILECTYSSLPNSGGLEPVEFSILAYCQGTSTPWGGLGDAKPDNVVVDADDNAWALDFGGGGIPGWLEPSMFRHRRGTCMLLQG
jgi:hypothetical protein